jgi:hypothetical protein
MSSRVVQTKFTSCLGGTYCFHLRGKSFLVLCLPCSTLNIEAVRSSETLVDYEATRHIIGHNTPTTLSYLPVEHGQFYTTYYRKVTQSIPN